MTWVIEVDVVDEEATAKGPLHGELAMVVSEALEAYAPGWAAKINVSWRNEGDDLEQIAEGPRPLPGDPTRCQRCRRPIIWAVTMAKESGPGGKAMPLDPIENPAGNVAVQPGHGGRLLARVLGKNERHSPPAEYLAMPHFATCGKP